MSKYQEMDIDIRWIPRSEETKQGWYAYFPKVDNVDLLMEVANELITYWEETTYSVFVVNGKSIRIGPASTQDDIRTFSSEVWLFYNYLLMNPEIHCSYADWLTKLRKDFVDSL